MTMKEWLAAGSSTGSYWECDACGFRTEHQDQAADHSTGCGVNPDKPVVVPGLEGMLDEFRRAVEEEAVELILMNLNATATAYMREGDSAEAGKYEDAAWIVNEHWKEWFGSGQ